MAKTSLRSRILANRRVLHTAQRARSFLNFVTTPTPELREWRRDDLYHKLQLTYDLDAASIVFDVGGFKGQWASDISAMYACRVDVFEPVPEYAEAIARRFARNPSVTVHAHGLAGVTDTATLNVAGDASSHTREGVGGDGVTVRLRSAADVLSELPPGRDVDLMKVNIEGAEYELIEHLLETGLIARVRDLQVQFHRFVPNAEPRMHALRGALERTHEPTYMYDFLWENWRRR